MFSLAQTLFHEPVGEREDEKPWLFETLRYNLPARARARRRFSYLYRHQPIEKARFGKINVSKRSPMS
jgi:hypothetical protein